MFPTFFAGPAKEAYGDPFATKKAEVAPHINDEYGARTRALFQNGGEQVAPHTNDDEYGARTWSLFQNGGEQVGSPQQLMGRAGEAAYAAKFSAGTALTAAGMQARSGYKQFANALPALTKDRLDFVALQAAGFGSIGLGLQKRKMEAYDALFFLSGPLRMQLLLALREMVKDRAVADPEMPDCVATRIETAVDRFWNDLIIYQEKLIEDARNAASGRSTTDHLALALLGSPPMPCTPFWFRCWFLYHFLPFDKSMFGCIKDPGFILLTAISIIPLFGIRILFFFVLLIFILRGCPADEYQLVNFILMFKGSQILSSGVGMTVVASVKYYNCVHADLEHTCDVDGPGATSDIYSGLIDFVGSCMLVWFAFLCLPCTGSKGGSRDLGLEDEHDMVNYSDGGYSQSDSDGPQQRGICRWCCRCCRRRWDPTRGGRLAVLLVWDLFSFILSFVLLVALCNVDVSHARVGGRPTDMTAWENISTWDGMKAAISKDFTTWEFRTTFFMIRIFYAFLSFPFVIFMLPILNSILTHTQPTGFNSQGLCVPYMLPPVAPRRLA